MLLTRALSHSSSQRNHNNPLWKILKRRLMIACVRVGRGPPQPSPFATQTLITNTVAFAAQQQQQQQHQNQQKITSITPEHAVPPEKRTTKAPHTHAAKI